MKDEKKLKVRRTVRNVFLLFMVMIVAYGLYTKYDISSVINKRTAEGSTESQQSGKLTLLTDPELTIEEGSLINLNFKGTYEGEDCGSGDHVDVQVIGGKLNEDFEQQLVGHHPGDEFTIQVKMSDRLSVKKKFRGKTADVEVKINGIYKLNE